MRLKACLFRQRADQAGGIEDAAMKLSLRVPPVAAGRDYLSHRLLERIHPINDDAGTTLLYPRFIFSLHGPHASALDDDQWHLGHQGFSDGHRAGLADYEVGQAVVVNRRLVAITEHELSVRRLQLV